MLAGGEGLYGADTVEDVIRLNKTGKLAVTRVGEPPRPSTNGPRRKGPGRVNLVEELDRAALHVIQGAHQPNLADGDGVADRAAVAHQGPGLLTGVHAGEAV